MHFFSFLFLNIISSTSIIFISNCILVALVITLFGNDPKCRLRFIYKTMPIISVKMVLMTYDLAYNWRFKQSYRSFYKRLCLMFSKSHLAGYYNFHFGLNCVFSLYEYLCIFYSKMRANYSSATCAGLSTMIRGGSRCSYILSCSAIADFSQESYLRG